MGNVDYDESGKFLPPKLAQEAITKSKDDIDWNKFDLDNDGNVDRLLILHTTTVKKMEAVVLTEYGVIFQN